MQQKESIRDKIVSAAETLFTERGFHRTAMADLAIEANVSVGAIYRNFPGKAEIIRAIILKETDETLHQVQTEIDLVRSGGQTAHAALERLFVLSESDQADALRHEVIAEAHRNSDIGVLIADFGGRFRAHFRDLARLIEPSLDDCVVEGVAELMVACMFGMANRDFTRPSLSGKDAAIAVTQLIMRGARA